MYSWFRVPNSSSSRDSRVKARTSRTPARLSCTRAEIELDLARDPDHRLAHREPERPGHEADDEQDDRVAPQLLRGDAAVEVVHREPQHLRLGEPDEVAERDAGEAPCEPAPVPSEV